MSRKIGLAAATINGVSVLGFAISMLCGFDFGSYLFSMFIAFSFIPLTCGFAYYADKKRKMAGFIALAFAAVYAAIILLVYFTQLTAVRSGNLSQQASAILDFKKFGLFFSYDLLGYALMALSTFFAGLTLSAQTKPMKALKWLLLIHGVFFISCLIMPMLGIFKEGGPDWVGVAVLEVWCAYFMPVSILSFIYFYGQQTEN